jgi:hypothetical protein
MSRLLAALLASSLLAAGCISTAYEFSQDVDGEHTLRLRPGEPQIERGEPNAFLDGIGHYVISLPSKILLLRWNVNNHTISPETEAALRAYLHDDDLHNVKVRLNQYAPGGEWRRLASNKDVGAFWRWSFGLITTTFYTILPGRFFAGLLGGDNYNPYTNTINIYSDNMPVVLHEGGHAKDFAQKSNRHWRGGYAVLRILPLVPLWQEAVATSDAISYLYEKDDVVQRKSAYRTLYPAYGTYVGSIGGEYGRFLPLSAARPELAGIRDRLWAGRGRTHGGSDPSALRPASRRPERAAALAAASPARDPRRDLAPAKAAPRARGAS